MDQFTIQKPWDMHVHLRDGEMLKTVAPITARYFARALVMPNLTPPIRTNDDVSRYQQEILAASGPGSGFKPLMTFKILPDTDPHSIAELAQMKDVVAGKAYPKGLTHNAEDGIEDYFALRDVFAAMEKHNLVLCLHGEMPGTHIRGRDRERAFLRTLCFLARTFPNLRIVLEHITTVEAVETVLRLPDTVAATVTAHHLLLTHDDVGGDRMCPNHYCKPVAKDPADRDALIQAAISGCPKFFFGSDSAPHPREGKTRLYDCCAGIFTAPVALPLLVEIFERHHALDRLESFVYDFAVQFYHPRGPATGFPPKLRFVKDQWTVPEEIGGIVPFYAGQELSWRVEEVK
ncbi:MAG: dihydroorotase [Parcubacteria group bacterium Gr01-1014_38]|nr:MAG: dihydroorotase [Parcubacteria group bacterium Gr01-1014_38]